MSSPQFHKGSPWASFSAMHYIRKEITGLIEEKRQKRMCVEILMYTVSRVISFPN